MILMTQAILQAEDICGPPPCRRSCIVLAQLTHESPQRLPASPRVQGPGMSIEPNADRLTVRTHFCGPTRSDHGGYTAGSLSRWAGETGSATTVPEESSAAPGTSGSPPIRMRSTKPPRPRSLLGHPALTLSARSYKRLAFRARTTES